MDDLSKLITALATLAWPLVFGVLLLRMQAPIRALIESAHGRRFTLKVAGNELTMEEASEQQRILLADLQGKLADLERRLAAQGVTAAASEPPAAATPAGRRFLWVDDKPRNNSMLVAALEERGARVDIALSTEEGLQALARGTYDALISDMARPEGEEAGIELSRRARSQAPGLPIYIYCGKWGATHLREPALAAGATDITASGSSLLAALLA